MGSGLFFPICALPFSILIMIIFFHKGYIKNEETRIYSCLIISNFIGLVIEILCTIASLVYDDYLVISNVIYKTYLVYLIVWIGLFLSYVQTISSSIEFDKMKKIKKVLKILLSLEIIIIYVLPIQLFVGENFSIRYTSGLSVTFSYFISGIDIAIIIMMLVRNIKKIKNKKYLPIFTFLLIGTLAIVVQGCYPQLLLMTYIETFITILMYFTIENPDMKLISELEFAKAQAERANASKTEFLSNMSHEIRTPLNAIVGFSQSLEEEDIPESAKDQVKDIISASDSLLELVNGILDISKIEANKLEIVNTEYNIYDVLDNLVALTKSRLGEKALDFRVEFDPSIPPILYGDYARLKQIILNLLTNAVKYTKEGYIEFKVSTVQKNNVCRLIISVEDSGIGIKEENINKLFTKFERFDLKQNITIEGTGLGLAITKKLVELMHGKIVVQSVYGKGSRFTVAIDQRIVNKKVEKKEPTVVDEIFDLTGKKVLVVDDNKLNLKVATKLLEKYHLDITTCESGLECIDRIKKDEKYDLILMDDMMPKLSGTETMQKLKEIPDFNMKVIALTANAISGMKEKYISAGFHDYLSKPIDKAELSKVLKKFIVEK